MLAKPNVSAASVAALISPVTSNANRKISMTMSAEISVCPSATNALARLSGLPIRHTGRTRHGFCGDIERHVVQRLREPERRVISPVAATLGFASKQIPAHCDGVMVDDRSRHVECHDSVGRRQTAAGRSEVDRQAEREQQAADGSPAANIGAIYDIHRPSSRNGTRNLATHKS